MATDPQEPFTVSTLASGGEVVLTPSGEIDLRSSPQLLEAGLRALDGGPRTLTIDCHRIRFFDSSGIRVLAVLRDTSLGQDGVLELIRVPKLVVAVVKMSGLADLLPEPE
jgi:anti-anti-sigma factor